MRDYINAKSLTFWSGLGSIVLGVILAFNARQPLGLWADVLQDLSGDAPPAMLVGMGLSVIGLRRAAGAPR